MVFERGDKPEAIAREEITISNHIAGKAALKHFRRYKKNNKTGFLGLTSAIKKSLFNFKPTPQVIALFYICADDYDYINDARAEAYHLAWHALDL